MPNFNPDSLATSMMAYKNAFNSGVGEGFIYGFIAATVFICIVVLVTALSVKWFRK